MDNWVYSPVTTAHEWITPNPDRESVRRLMRALDCSPVLATILASRGFTDPAAAKRTLRPSAEAIHPPDTLPDIEGASTRLTAAVDGEEHVVVYGDRDVDGVTGAAILTTLFEEFGTTTTPYVPGKWDGYGLHDDAVNEFVDRDVELLVAVDCGTTAHEAIGRARSSGMDVVVIDHHNPDEHLPDANACVNPRRSDSDYPNADLSAGALAWKVGQAVVQQRSPIDIEPYHRRALPLAAVSTIGDYMPLTLENRAIVREGFTRLESCDLPGLVRTADHCGVDSMRDLGWSLVPLLNAAQEAPSGDLMLETLLAREPARIDDRIDRLKAYRTDRRRQRAERRAHLEECFESQVDPEAVAVFVIETDRYVGGGPMSQLSKTWYRPVVTYRKTDDGYRGGGRTEPNVDLLELYGACNHLLEEYWGHPGAAGFRVTDENLDPFVNQLRKTLHARYDTTALRPTVDIDAIVDVTDLDTGLVDALDDLGPFGTDNDQPVVLVEAVTIADWERFGEDGRHWKGWPTAADDVTIIDWNGDTVEASGVVLEPPITVDVAGTLSVDDYSGGVALAVEAIRNVDEGVRTQNRA